MLANELSVKVLWKFLETAVPDKWLSNEWWMEELPKKKNGKLNFGKEFERDAIKMKPPKDWDMSLLALAIQNHPNLSNDAVKNMKDKRNALSHKCRATYAKKEFDQLSIDLVDSYKSLLGESEARQDFCEDLKKVKESKFSTIKALEYVNYM